jgi:hypothetical protein
MKFFVPGLADAGEAERFYAILRVIAAGRHGPLSARRIHSITYSRGRALHTATVGEADTASMAGCAVIFEAAKGGLCFLYTEGPIAQTGQLIAPLHVEPFEDFA